MTYCGKKREQDEVSETCALKLGTHKIFPREGLPCKMHSMFLVAARQLARTQTCINKAGLISPISAS